MVSITYPLRGHDPDGDITRYGVIHINDPTNDDVRVEYRSAIIGSDDDERRPSQNILRRTREFGRFALTSSSRERTLVYLVL